MDNLKIYTDFLISPLGPIKIQATSHEIIKVIFDSKKTNSLNNSLTKECQKQLTEYFMGKRKVFDIPFSFKGTNFQEAIWSAITKLGRLSTKLRTSIDKIFERADFIGR